jgi:Lon protease-like protein
MFPLSSVVYPHQRVPLHVFEPRYRQLVDDVHAGDGRFGICLIARGSEVGGGDQRVNVGTIVQLEALFPFSDGRSMLVVDGRERIRVVEWLADCPYPRAVVEIMVTDEVPSNPSLLHSTEAAVRSLRNLHSEMHPDSCVEVDCSMADKPCERAWQLCALAPMATLDQLKLLQADSCDERLRLLGEICCERYGDLMRQLTASSPD